MNLRSDKGAKAVSVQPKKIFVMPKCVVESENSVILSLPHPRNGNKTNFLKSGEKLFEINCIETEGPKSWLVGNSVVKGGKLYVTSPIDPLFLLLPILDPRLKQRSEEDETPKFKSWKVLIPSVFFNIEGLQDKVHILCDIKTVDLGDDEDNLYYRVNETKVKYWIDEKFNKLVDHLILQPSSSTGLLKEQPRYQAYLLLSDYLTKKWSDYIFKTHQIDQIEEEISKAKVVPIQAISSVPSFPVLVKEPVDEQIKNEKKTKPALKPVAPPKGSQAITSFFKKV